MQTTNPSPHHHALGTTTHLASPSSPSSPSLTSPSPCPSRTGVAQRARIQNQSLPRQLTHRLQHLLHLPSHWHRRSSLPRHRSRHRYLRGRSRRLRSPATLTRGWMRLGQRHSAPPICSNGSITEGQNTSYRDKLRRADIFFVFKLLLQLLVGVFLFRRHCAKGRVELRLWEVVDISVCALHTPPLPHHGELHDPANVVTRQQAERTAFNRSNSSCSICFSIWAAFCKKARPTVVRGAQCDKHTVANVRGPSTRALLHAFRPSCAREQAWACAPRHPHDQHCAPALARCVSRRTLFSFAAYAYESGTDGSL